MNSGSWVVLVLAGLAAAGDWLAVVLRQKRLEYVCKPLTIALLMVLALTVDVDNPAVRDWFLIALALSMLGDVCLMVTRDLFVLGLGSFLLAHIAYIIGMWVDGISVLAVVIGLGATAVVGMVIGGRILDAVRSSAEHHKLAVPVAAYMGAISVMLASAIGTEKPLAIGGAALFYCSDALIAWERFVRPRVWHRLGIIVTYHVAQAGLTLSLVT